MVSKNNQLQKEIKAHAHTIYYANEQSSAETLASMFIFEEKRRTKIIPQHQNEKGAMKLVFGVLLRASQNWQRITMKELDLVMLRNIRQTIVPEIELEEKLSYEWAA
jgi:transposase-like protein